MAGGNTVTVRFAGEDSGFQRVARQVADEGEESAGRLRRSFDRAGDAADASESKFMGMADVLDGLGGAFGVPTEGATNLMRSFGDLSGGFAILQPAIGGVTSSMKAMGLSMLTNPVFLVIAGVVALTAALVIAYQRSETFREIVNGAFRAVADTALAVFGWIADAGSAVWKRLEGPVTAYVNFYKAVFTGIIDIAKSVFNAVARAWNNTFGKLSFSIPDIPGVPGRGTRIDIPDIPTLHSGTPYFTPPGGADEGLALLQRGEQVIPRGAASASAAGPVVVVNNYAPLTDRAAADYLVRQLEDHFRRGGAIAGAGGRTLKPV